MAAASLYLNVHLKAHLKVRMVPLHRSLNTNELLFHDRNRQTAGVYSEVMTTCDTGRIQVKQNELPANTGDLLAFLLFLQNPA